MATKTKLELTWIGKDVRPKLEPRILLEDPAKSYHAKYSVKGNGYREGAKNAKKTVAQQGLPVYKAVLVT